MRPSAAHAPAAAPGAHPLLPPPPADLEKWEAGEGRARAAASAAAGIAATGTMDMLAVQVSAVAEGAQAAPARPYPDPPQDHSRRTAEAQRAAAEAQRMELYRASLGPARLAEMKRQAELQQAMQYAFRSGNAKEAERIKRLLEPEKPPVTW